MGGFGFVTRKSDAFLNVSDAPGPCTYDGSVPTASQSKKGSSAFASKSKQREERTERTPGVGDYEPRGAAVIPGGSAGFKSRADRFKPPAEEQNGAIGPGSYTGGHSTIATRHACGG